LKIVIHVAPWIRVSISPVVAIKLGMTAVTAVTIVQISEGPGLHRLVKIVVGPGLHRLVKIVVGPGLLRLVKIVVGRCNLIVAGRPAHRHEYMLALLF
jgi:hypothetical protein